MGITGASDHAYRATGVESGVNGKALTEENIAAAAAHAADGMTMLSDLTASASYRAHLSQAYTERALNLVLERLNR